MYYEVQKYQQKPNTSYSKAQAMEYIINECQDHLERLKTRYGSKCIWTGYPEGDRFVYLQIPVSLVNPFVD